MPGIFISYRRSDSPDSTGRIYDCLVAEFGRAQVFKDIDSIPLGRDFRSHLNEIVGDCAAVLAIVGPHWTDMRDEAGKRRLEDADDFVRIELEAAMARDVPVVPVLVGHALMPASAQLPASLAQLAFRQSIEVRPDPDFHNDSTRLVSALRRIIDPSAAEIDEFPEGITPAAGAVKAEAKANRRAVRAMSIAAVAVVGMIAMLVPTLRHLRETPPPPPPETRVDIVTPATDQLTSFALSPDGRQIVYVAAGDGTSRLWLRSLATTTAQPQAGTEGAIYPFWSPDGRSVGFFAGGALKRLDLGGGAPRILASAGAGRGGTWGTDGVILYTPGTAAPLMRVSAAGGAAAVATTLGPQQRAQRFPQFLPDGRRFLFYVLGTVPETTGIYVGALDGSTPTRLTSADGAGAYLRGWLLWVRSGALVAQRLDLAKATLIGEPMTLADGVAIDASFRGAVSVAAGLVAYRSGGSGLRQLTWFDRSGAARGAVGELDGSVASPRVSPDGRRVVVVRTVQGNQDLWLLEGARTSRFTFDVANDVAPIWSPDGTRIVFRSGRSGGSDLYQKLTNGTGAEELLVSSGQLKSPFSWSADGRFLLYVDINPTSDGDLWNLPMSGDRTPSVFLKTRFFENAAAFSPDGRWVAYYSDESGRAEIYVRPFVPPGAAGNTAGSGGQWQVSTAGGIYPLWRPDGRELYYLSPEGAMMAAPIRVTGATLEPGAPVRLFAARIVGGGAAATQGRQYDVAPDGRFLINTQMDSAAVPITLIQNWNPEASKQ